MRLEAKSPTREVKCRSQIHILSGKHTLITWWPKKQAYKSNTWSSHWTTLNTTWSNITPTSELVDISIPRQSFTNGWACTKKSKLRFKQFHQSSSWSNLQNCNPATTTSSYNAKAVFYGHIECFQNALHTLLKMLLEMIKAMKIKPSHSQVRRESTQTFKQHKRIRKGNSWWRANFVSTKMCPTRTTSYN